MTEAPAYCINCGYRLPEEAAFCPRCGTRAVPVPEERETIVIEPPATTMPIEYQTPLAYVTPAPEPAGLEEEPQAPSQAGTFWFGFAVGFMVMAIAAMGAVLLGYIKVGPDRPDLETAPAQLSTGNAVDTAPQEAAPLAPETPEQSAPSEDDAAALAPDAPEQSAPPEDSAAPVVPAPDSAEIASVAAYLAELVRRNEPALAANLIGTNGVSFAPYASEAQLPGHNNSEHIVAELTHALAAGSPECLGYIPRYGDQPPKALVLFGGMGFDWPKLGLKDPLSGVTGFGFFEEQGRWELTFIGPVPVDLMPPADLIRPVPVPR